MYGQASLPKPETPHSDLAAFLVARNYVDLGCDKWNSRLVLLLCAKFGDTPTVMAARLRLRPFEFQKRMDEDNWTKQEGLLLSILEREIDAVRGAVPPRPLIEQGAGGGL